MKEGVFNGFFLNSVFNLWFYGLYKYQLILKLINFNQEISCLINHKSASKYTKIQLDFVLGL